MPDAAWDLDKLDKPDFTGIRVPFDDGPTDTMPLDWAEKFIRYVRKNNPAAFMAAMQRGVFGIEQLPGRGRPRNEGREKT